MDTGGQIAAFGEKKLMCISFFFFQSAIEHSPVADQYLLDRLGIGQSRYLVIDCVQRFNGGFMELSFELSLMDSEAMHVPLDGLRTTEGF